MIREMGPSGGGQFALQGREVVVAQVIDIEVLRKELEASRRNGGGS